MRTMLTGATGFLGRELSIRLAAQDHVVSALVRRADGGHPVPIERQHECGDDSSRILDAMRKERPEVVVHLAAIFVGEHRPEQVDPLIRSNILFGCSVLEAMREVGCDSIVTAGTAWQHGEDGRFEPVNLYAATKQAFEDICAYYRLSHGLRAIHLHLCDIYGERDTRRKLLVLLDESTVSDVPLSLSPGGQRISLVHVEDASRAFGTAVAQVRSMEPGEVRVRSLASDSSPTIRELVALFDRIDPSKPAKVAWGGRPYRHREPMIPRPSGIPLEDHENSIDLEEGLRRFRTRRGPLPAVPKETR